MNIRILYVLTPMLAGMLLAGCATETRVDPLEPIELGNLTFLAPSGEEWEYLRDDSSNIESVLFASGGRDSPVYGMLVWQARLEDPVNSAEDIWDSLLEPYRKVWHEQRKGEINKTECDPDQTLTEVGLLCLVGGKVDTRGLLNFWVRRFGPNDIVDAEGHIYAFVLPGDKREVGVIEYFQQLRPGVEPVDTEQLLAEFARNVVLLK